MTLDTVADESRKKEKAYGVTWSPAQYCSRDEKLCNYGRLEYDFLAFVHCFLLSSFSPCLSRYVYLRVPSSGHSSHLLLSASAYFVVRFLSACVICTLPHLGILLFFYSCSFFVLFVALISRVAFFCCALVPDTLALDLTTLIL